MTAKKTTDKLNALTVYTKRVAKKKPCWTISKPGRNWLFEMKLYPPGEIGYRDAFTIEASTLPALLKAAEAEAAALNLAKRAYRLIELAPLSKVIAKAAKKKTAAKVKDDDAAFRKAVMGAVARGEKKKRVTGERNELRIDGSVILTAKVAPTKKTVAKKRIDYTGRK